MATRKKNLLIDHPAWTERLSDEWDWEKNEKIGMRPDEITAGSEKKVWWLGECGHEWLRSVKESIRRTGKCPYCSGKQVLNGFNDLATTNPDLAEEWHPTKNGNLTPQELTAGSNRKVWWLGECGHEWDAVINSRSQGRQCPICTGKKVLAGFNDLATTNPDLAEEWHPTRNGSLTPKEVTAGSRRKVWWLGKCGHEWDDSIQHRTNMECNCPICAGKRVLTGFNDLATTNPDLAEEWHPTKNGDLAPQEVTKMSGKKVWWLGECGHEWEQRVADRSNGQGCPICAGRQVLAGFNDLATTNPDLADEWHPTRNGELTPQDVVAGSTEKIWWLGECGHEWEARINSRTRGNGCPYCAGQKVLEGFNDLATTNPSLAEEWHPTKNGELSPQEVTAGSQRKVWWLGECGHEWQATISSRSRTKGAGCPKCSSSKGEKDAASWAVSQGFVVDEQWKDDECRDKLPLPFDLMLYSVAGTALMETALVEYDGIQHSDETTYFNQKNLTSGRGFSYVQRHDAIKTEFCERTNRTLIRVPHTVAGEEAIGEFISEKLIENGLDWAVVGCDSAVA